MKYQFSVDNRPAGPVRDLWELAAGDAVAMGYAAWTGNGGVSLDEQAAIRRIDDSHIRAAVDEACDARLRFLRGLRTWDIYGRGWTRQVEEARRNCDTAALRRMWTRTAEDVAAAPARGRRLLPYVLIALLLGTLLAIGFRWWPW